MFWDILLDSLLDALKVLPFILVIYLVIEWVESTTTGGQKVTRLLQKPTAPVFSALLGVIPQCGFSCVATNLYNRRYIAMGTLLAVYISTSDEAIPILLGSALTNPNALSILWKVIVVKIVYAVLVGFAVNLVIGLINKGRKNGNLTVVEEQKVILADNSSAQNDSCAKHREHEHGKKEDSIHKDEADCNEDAHDIGEHLTAMHDETHGDKTVGCCNHEIKKGGNFWNFVKHPLIHSAKIFVYLFVVNILFGLIIDMWLGEENIASFMQQALYAQPFVVGLVGLVPNCAASVIITELLLQGTISFGSALSGLCCNAGVGLALLFANKKNTKNNFILLGILYVSSCILGIILTLLA